MMIAARNAFLTGGAKLPYDAEVEYIESTGAQWIDSGYISTHMDEVISADIIRLVDNASYAIFGSWGSSVSERLQLFSDAGRIGGNFVSWGANTIPKNRLTRVSADIPNLRFVIAGTQYSSSGMTKPLLVVPVSIFVRNDGGSLFGFGAFRLCAFAISRGGVLVLDCIPVRVGSGSSAVGYLYDRANPAGGPLGNGLYPNAGTGAFVVGPDK